ncbi:hypothetical protein EIP86_005452 [Pleurotus ostreatoroseus]|nr:hypothetical protein EIP86_005452 [Pleurotus ostreatoroseus]
MSEHSARHHPQQVSPATNDPFWVNPDAAHDASSDNGSLGINTSWPQSGISYPQDFVFPQDEHDYFNDNTFFSGEEASSPNISSEFGGMSNALGLDPATASSRSYGQSMTLHATPPQVMRLPHLPQIMTADLHSPYTYPHSPLVPSPADYHSNPYSASPVSMPLTPASLPPSSTLAPPYIAGTSHLSPNSPYMHPYGSPIPPKSPYLASSPASPSARSYASYSPTDEISPTAHVPRAQGQVQQTVLELAAAFPGIAATMIPQRVYRPHTQSDRRRYVEEVDLEAPIMFYTSHPDGLGISCRDALNCKFARLVGRDDQMFVNRGPSVSIRLMVRAPFSLKRRHDTEQLPVQWPGYAPWSRQIPTRDFRSPPGPITRSKLAKNVAKTVQRFLEEMRLKPMEEDADPRWRVANRITIDALELVGLQHVSMGSWQAHLRIRPHP